MTDTASNVSTMTYDLLGRKTDMWDPDMGHWHYEYDALGNLTSQTDAKNQTLSFEYDDLNRLTLKDLPLGTDVQYYYDEDGYGHSIGQRTRMTDASGDTQWFYDDARGHLTEERKTIQGEEFITGWAYDAADRVREMTYPPEDPDQPGEVVTTVYNPQGLPETLTGASAYVDGASYTALGQTALLTLGGAGLDLQVKYDYYSDDQRLEEIWIGASDWPGQRGRFRYEYDDVGNVLAVEDRRWVAGVQQLQVQTFAYDALDRLTSGSTSGAGTWGSYSEGYTYNAIGNLTSKGGATYTYPASGAGSIRPHAVRRVTGSGGTSKTVQIRAYSSPCNDGVRATMELWVNGAKKKTWTDVSGSWTTYAISVTLSGNDQIEVVFPNDCNAGGYDRNLFVDYVVVDGRTIQAEGGAAIIDKGSGSAAFDGLDVLAGQQGLFWDGALRFVVGDDAAAACYDANGNPSLCSGQA